MTVEGFKGWPLVCVLNLIDWQVLGEALSAHFSQPEAASGFIWSSLHKTPLSGGSPSGCWTRDGRETPGQPWGPAWPRGEAGTRWKGTVGAGCLGWGQLCAGGEQCEKVTRGWKGWELFTGVRVWSGTTPQRSHFWWTRVSFFSRSCLPISTPGRAAQAPAVVCVSPRAPQVTRRWIRFGCLALCWV